MSNDDLLTPMLSDTQRIPALYNATGFFLSAFFGGPVGAVMYGGANSYRLSRLAKDVPVLFLIVAVAFSIPFVLHQTGSLQKLLALAGGRAARNCELLLRALGLLSYGAIYLMHRNFFRLAAVTGNKALPGWAPGIAAVLSGFFVNAVFVQWLLKHH